MQPNRDNNVYDNDNLDPPQENPDVFEEAPLEPTVFVLVAKNIIIFGSAAIMIFFFVMIVKYFF